MAQQDSWAEMLAAVQAFHDKHDFKNTGGEELTYRVALMAEELGEISSAVSKGKPREALAEEVADLLILLMGTGIAAEFDLNAAFWQKMDKLMQRSSRMVEGRIRVSEFRDMEPSPATRNELVAIHPYKVRDLWVFDDEQAGLVQEPFVAGADLIIDAMVTDIPHADQGFTLVFSAHPFPGHQLALERRKAEANGHWYFSPSLDLEGWFCPALLRYFATAPEQLYAQFRAGVI